MNLCLFDLDHTLLPIDSDHAWGEFAIEWGWADPQQYKAGNDYHYARYLQGCLDIAEYIRFSTRPLQGRSPSELDEARDRFMAQRIGPHIRPEALQLIAQHRQTGDLIALVTATNEFVTTPISAALGLEHLLAVRLQRDAQGGITGEIEGIPTYQAGKVHRVHEWLAGLGRKVEDFEEITVYSDSINDLPLLELATQAVVTNAGASLLAVARQRGWRELTLFS